MRKRSNKQDVVGPEALPSAAAGESTGTVEVDPEMEGVEVDDELGDVAAPPRARGAVKSASARRPEPSRKPVARKAEVSSVELDSDDVLEIEDPVPARPPGPGTAVRNAVKMPSGPIDLPEPPTASARDRSGRRSAADVLAVASDQSAQPDRGRAADRRRDADAATADGPRTDAASIPERDRECGAPDDRAQRGPAAIRRGRRRAVHRRATALRPRVGALGDGRRQGGRRRTDAATARDRSAARVAGERQRHPGGGEMSVEVPVVKARKTGVRKGRSRLQIAIWILIGGAVIGGGVFAGFQIRAMRLGKQIAAARDQAVDLAKADTWQGWAGARDRLAGIAHASATVDNFAALARARAVLAYEFGDGLADAKTAVDKLGAQGGLDTAIAAAYVALAQNDPKAAKQAVDHASQLGANDAAVLYVTGQASLLAGDYKGAITSLRTAHEREPRPLYAIGLARAIAATGAWEDALAAVDRALGAMPDHPAGVDRARPSSSRRAAGSRPATRSRTRSARSS